MEQQRLKVAIIGAGLNGLAIALSNSRSPF